MPTAFQPFFADVRGNGFPFCLGPPVSEGLVEVTRTKAMELYWLLRACRMSFPRASWAGTGGGIDICQESEANYFAFGGGGAVDGIANGDPVVPYRRVCLYGVNQSHQDGHTAYFFGDSSENNNSGQGEQAETPTLGVVAYASVSGDFAVRFSQSTNSGMVWLDVIEDSYLGAMYGYAISIWDESSPGHPQPDPGPSGYGEYKGIRFGNTPPPTPTWDNIGPTYFSEYLDFEYGSPSLGGGPVEPRSLIHYTHDHPSAHGSVNISSQKTLTLAGIDFPYYEIDQIYSLTDGQGGNYGNSGTEVTRFPTIAPPTGTDEMFGN